MDHAIRRSFRTDAIHFTTLWSLGTAHPIFDLLGENPEFFVAHDAHALDLAGFVLFVCGLGPLVALSATWAASRIGPRSRSLMTWMVVTSFLFVVVLPIVKRSWEWDAVLTLTAAGSMSGLLAWGYVRLSALRLFVTFLAPAIIVVPLLFVLQPGVTRLLRASEVRSFQGVEFTMTPPVVMVVFDQLPLVSLLDRDGRIDASLYPSFASLADEATWFSNASGVAGLTELAMPALLTGIRPTLGRLPVADDYPGNLFTLFGSRYRVVATEPITRLCPDTVCQGNRPSLLTWLRASLSDVVIVYLHIVLPDAIADRLPPVTRNWKDFAANDTWMGRWEAHRGSDRERLVTDFVRAIGPTAEDGRPPFYFLHLLLPHEPWVYLPSGQRYATGSVAGLNRDGNWADNEMAVLRSYQRHLLQVRFADELLGRILERLRHVGLYDDALIVVTADHGAGFQPGGSFRRPNRSLFVETAAVPLVIKVPGQHSGEVIRTNTETIDVVPTMAGVLGADLPWVPDGADMLAPDAAGRPKKKMIFADGSGSVAGPGDLAPVLAEMVAQKYARFDLPDGFNQPNIGLYDELVGRRLSELDVATTSAVEVFIDGHVLFEDVDPAGPFVPAHLTGAVTGPDSAARASILAVSLNGVVAGVTRPYSFPVGGREGAWELVIDARLVLSGANDVGVYVVRPDRDGSVVLDEAFRMTDTTRNANLILDQAGPALGVTTAGFFLTEWAGPRPFRWTARTATLHIPVDLDTPPETLIIDVLMTGPTRKALTITVNDDCTVFDGKVFGGWSASLPLSGCRIDRGTVEVRLRSDVSVLSHSDRRELGVAVGSIELR